MKKKFASIKIISVLWIGALLGSVIGFITQVILARQLGAETYGLFSSSLGTVNLIAPLAGFGVSSLWLKVFGQEGWSAVRWVKPSIMFLFWSTISVIITLVVWANTFSHDSNTKDLVQLLSITVIGQASIEVLKSKLQLEEKFGALTLYQLLIPLLRVILVITTIFYSKLNVIFIGLGYAIISIIVFAICATPIYKTSLGSFELKGHKKNKNESLDSTSIGPIDVLRNSWVFGFATMFYVLWSQSNVVILKYLLGDVEAGLYSVALLVINAICIFPSVVYSKFLMPKIHRWSNHDQERLKYIFYLGNKLMFCIGLAFMFLVFVTSSYSIPLVFGDEYTESIKILILLSLTLPIRFVGHSVGALLVAKEYMKVKVKVMSIVAIVNITMNFIIIPKVGLIGVAYVAIFNEILLLALYYILVRKFYVSKSWA
mgnify:CR=1 FL=1